MATMTGMLICIMIVFIDIAAGILGIEAEVEQNKGQQYRVLIFECKEPVYQAYLLGLAAAVLLALAHALSILLGGCICICSPEEFARSTTNKQMTAATLGVSWIALVIGFAMLMIGAMSNSKSRASCGFPHRHLLSVGGVLCFVHGLFSVVYYVAASASATAWEEERMMTTRDIVRAQSVATSTSPHNVNP